MTQKRIKRPQRSVAIRGITGAAKKLGVPHSYLSRVLHGKARSPALFKRAEALLKNEQGFRIELRKNDTISAGCPADAELIAQQIGPHNCRIEAGAVVITAPTTVIVTFRQGGASLN